jgi:predicted nucleic acid-binding protein
MRVLVDTPIWSLALRRRSSDLNPDEARLKDALAELIREGRVIMVGPVRQELLSGIRDGSQFNRVRERLEPVRDLPIETSAYEDAARMSNLCSSRGVANTSVDMLICAVAVAAAVSILTIDRDFLTHYSKILPIKLFQAI